MICIWRYLEPLSSAPTWAAALAAEAELQPCHLDMGCYEKMHKEHKYLASLGHIGDIKRISWGCCWGYNGDLLGSYWLNSPESKINLSHATSTLFNITKRTKHFPQQSGPASCLRPHRLPWPIVRTGEPMQPRCLVKNCRANLPARRFKPVVSGDAAMPETCPHSASPSPPMLSMAFFTISTVGNVSATAWAMNMQDRWRAPELSNMHSEIPINDIYIYIYLYIYK